MEAIRGFGFASPPATTLRPFGTELQVSIKPINLNSHRSTGMGLQRAGDPFRFQLSVVRFRFFISLLSVAREFDDAIVSFFGEVDDFFDCVVF